MEARPAAPLAPEDVHAVVSHLIDELCRPLSILESCLQTLIPVSSVLCPDDPTPGLLAICQELQTISGDFLQHTWIDCGGAPPAFRSIRLSNLMELASHSVAPGPVSFRVSGKDAEVQTDRDLVLAVLARLVDNAIRFSPPETSVCVTATADEGAWSLVVEDRGPGIPPANLATILSPFTRLPRDVKAGIPGSGLGLATCRAMVQSLGGTIVVEAPDQGGTRVRMDLPNAPVCGSENPVFDPVAKRSPRC